jgi:hypothetical protein
MALMIQAIAIYSLWLSAIFDPIGSIYGFRYIALLVVFLVMAYNAILNFNGVFVVSTHIRFCFIFCFFFPVYGLVVGLMRNGVWWDNFIDTSYFASAVYFASTLLFVQNGNYKLAVHAFLFSTRMLSVLIILIALILSFSLPFDCYYFVGQGVAYFGERVYGGVSFYYIYFVASPMLIILLAYETWFAIDSPSFFKFFRLFLVFIAMFLSGTRASMVVAIITPLIVLLYKKRSIAWSFSIFFIILPAFTLFALYQSSVFSEMFSLTNPSNNVKLAYLNDYGTLFNDPLTLFFGQGFNAHEWSNVFSEMLSGGASKTELTYLELVRVFGVFGAFCFAGMVFLFFMRQSMISSEYRWVFPSTALYLLVASSNPYIFSSNGMLVLGLVTCLVSLPHSKSTYLT